MLADPDARERMLAGLPVTERRLTLSGVSTAVLEGGEGPPLVLLHGGIECGGVFWTPAISRLAERHRLVVPDVPGLGESEPIPRLDQAAFDSWLGELVRESCPEGRPTLVAHSLCGTLAARFAADHGDLLRRLVICAAPGVGPYRMPMRLRVVAIRFALRPTERNAQRFERFALLDRERTRGRDPSWFDAFSDYSRSRAAVRHVKKTMQQLIKAGTRQVPDAALRAIPVPTSLVWGRHDRMVPLALAEGAGSRLGLPLHVVEGVAHAPQIEEPEAFLRTIYEKEEARS